MISNFPQIALVLSLLALAVSGYLLWQTSSLTQLREAFFAGQDKLDLETMLKTLAKDLEQSKKENKILQKQLAEIQNNFVFAVQKIGVVRFNPFADAGGNFSFCLALLDGHDNGVILTSMHGREQNRVYAKNITGGQSDIVLTEEEIKAIKLAGWV